MNLNRTYTTRLCAVLLTLTLTSACSRYAVTVNDNPVYTPATLLRDYAVVDPALDKCLQQAIADGGYRSTEEVKRIICSYAGVKNLEGLEQFHNLRELKLSHNELQSITPLRTLTQLKTLLLEGNQLEQVPELLTLPNLRTVDLRENCNLNCADAAQLSSLVAGDTRLPNHCK